MSAVISNEVFRQAMQAIWNKEDLNASFPKDEHVKQQRVVVIQYSEKTETELLRELRSIFKPFKIDFELLKENVKKKAIMIKLKLEDSEQLLLDRAFEQHVMHCVMTMAGKGISVARKGPTFEYELGGEFGIGEFKLLVDKTIANWNIDYRGLSIDQQTRNGHPYTVMRVLFEKLPSK
jgi:hypothetical protein